MGFFRQEYWSGLPFPSPHQACLWWEIQGCEWCHCLSRLAPLSCPPDVPHVTVARWSWAAPTPQLWNPPPIYLHLLICLGSLCYIRFKEEGPESLGGRAVPENKEPELPEGSRTNKPGMWSLASQQAFSPRELRTRTWS